MAITRYAVVPPEWRYDVSGEHYVCLPRRKEPYARCSCPMTDVPLHMSIVVLFFLNIPIGDAAAGLGPGTIPTRPQHGALHKDAP